MSEVESTGGYDWAGRIRPIAICVFRRPDGALLLAPGYDKVKGQAFYRPLGGEIEFGELAVDAVRREIREELGCEPEDPRLLGVFENIFTYLGASGHELVWVFEARLSDASLYEVDAVTAREGKFSFEARWVPLDQLKRGDVPVYPEGVLAAIEGVT